jgi:hypothetical protein
VCLPQRYSVDGEVCCRPWTTVCLPQRYFIAISFSSRTVPTVITQTPTRESFRYATPYPHAYVPTPLPGKPASGCSWQPWIVSALCYCFILQLSVFPPRRDKRHEHRTPAGDRPVESSSGAPPWCTSPGGARGRRADTYSTLVSEHATSRWMHFPNTPRRVHVVSAEKRKQGAAARAVALGALCMDHSCARDRSNGEKDIESA